MNLLSAVNLGSPATSNSIEGDLEERIDSLCRQPCSETERAALHNKTSEPITCPQPAKSDRFDPYTTYEDDVEHYNKLTWAMYFRIMNARRAYKGMISKKGSPRPGDRIITQCCYTRVGTGTNAGHSDMTDEVFYLEM